MTVLSIDDDVISQKLLRAVLAAKFNVVTENSGARAIQAAEAAEPRLILLDLGMPNVDGFEVLDRLKNHPSLSAVPVVCLSGKIDEASRSRAYAHGAAGFLLKPINIATIASDLEAIIAKLNTEVVSTDGRRRLFIARNIAVEREQLRASLNRALEMGRTVVLLSFLDPETFLDEPAREKVRSGQLQFLQIKPSLMARLPYLQEFGSIIEDIEQLTRVMGGQAPGGGGGSSGNAGSGVGGGSRGSARERPYLFLDGLERLFDLSDGALVMRLGLALGETFMRHFEGIEYYCSAPRRNEVASENLNQLATVLVS